MAEKAFSSKSSLKSAAVLDLMREHLKTDDGKNLQSKIGLVYQIVLSPKVGGVPIPRNEPSAKVPQFVSIEHSVILIQKQNKSL
ncbi:unnamed protein product [Calypogeia fissa]